MLKYPPIFGAFGRLLSWTLVGCFWVVGDVLMAGGEPVKIYHFENGDRVKGRQVGDDGINVQVLTENFGTLKLRKDQILRIVADEPESQTEREAAPASIAGGGTSIASNGTPPRLWRRAFHVSTEIKRDGGSRKNVLLEATVQRDWTRGEFRTKVSYEFTEENQKTTTDIQKAEIYGRYDVLPRWFVLYSPQEELNRNRIVSNIRIRYLLLQQRVGFGREFVKNKTTRLRIGVAENFVNIWAWRGRANAQLSTRFESLFLETELNLPWKLTFTNRGAYYFSDRDGNGAENLLEITRQLDRHWRLTFRHEYRSDHPGVDVSNLNLWRLVLGLEY